MKNTSLITMSVMVATGLLTPLAANANGQLWLQFAHPNNPHVLLTSPDMRLSIPELLQGPGGRLTRG